MIVVTSGALYIDIDAYACMVAYAELLNVLGILAAAATSAPLNESITPSLRALPTGLLTDYQPSAEDTFVIVDVSDSSQFDHMVDIKRVVEVYDHHPGFEQFWSGRIGQKSHLETIGAAATQIFEAWQRAGKTDQMSKASAQLLLAAILDNTLNFGAGVTTDRDKRAYDYLMKHAGVDEKWVAKYFEDCQAATVADIASTLGKDTKYFKWKGLDGELTMGQLVVWDGTAIMQRDLATIEKVFDGNPNLWLVNLVSIHEGHSYFITSQPQVQQWLSGLTNMQFTGTIAQADRLWLRKEIMKLAQQSS